jgi:protoheme IX farnesyltransferase
MLPVVRGEAYTRASIVRYSVLLLVVSLLPIVTRSLSWLYLAAALGLGLLFVFRAVRLARAATTARAWGLFKFSNLYLALLYLAMVLDRVIALAWSHS